LTEIVSTIPEARFEEKKHLVCRFSELGTDYGWEHSHVPGSIQCKRCEVTASTPSEIERHFRSPEEKTKFKSRILPVPMQSPAVDLPTI
jgi:hypothetical protein